MNPIGVNIMKYATDFTELYQRNCGQTAPMAIFAPVNNAQPQYYITNAISLQDAKTLLMALLGGKAQSVPEEDILTVAKRLQQLFAHIDLEQVEREMAGELDAKLTAIFKGEYNGPGNDPNAPRTG